MKLKPVIFVIIASVLGIMGVRFIPILTAYATWILIIILVYGAWKKKKNLSNSTSAKKIP